MRRRGFTIVELIIVVTIMAILLTLGVVNLRGSQANARDTERKTDIESIAQHLETYYTSGTDSSTASSCTGGTITRDGLFTVHTFTTSGTLTCTGSSITATELVVGGGGGGGQSVGGGGGGGGFRTGALSLTNAAPYTVTVGSGGAIGLSGTSSIFSSITSDGGGRGGNFYGSSSVDAGVAGASGGGGSSCYPACASVAGTGVAGEGYAGGNGYNYNTGALGAYSSGGGGGAGGIGEAGTRSSAGNGGPGLSSSISGTLTYYAGGGAGGYIYEYGVAITEGSGGVGGGGKFYGSGAANTGGGGGASGAGGSGAVIIRYATPTTSNTYPSTALTNTTIPAVNYVTNLSNTLRDIDLDSVTAPGYTDPITPSQTFISATNAVQTTAGVLPQPTINQYVYQPIHTDGSLCNDNAECSEFNLYYRTEVDNVIHMVSSIDQ